MSAYLKEVGAIFPQRDPLYDPELKINQLEKISTDVLQRMEKQRMNMLSEDFDPGNNWWGSKGPKNN